MIKVKREKSKVKPAKQTGGQASKVKPVKQRAGHA
jgi:hypothetical protein